MSGFVAHNRHRFLNAAVEDTLRWCAQPDGTVIGNHPTDQYWIRAFAPSAPETDADTARHFLGTLKLASKWDYDAVAALINDLRASLTFSPARDVPVLAEALQRRQDRGILCTVAASKLAQVVFPAMDVHVWHDRSWQAVLLHEQQSLDRAAMQEASSHSCDHDYAAYHAGCRRILKRELARSDFVEAASLVTTLLRALPGPLADCTIPDNFFQQYLLDKLLFHQGWHSKYGRVAHSEALETGLENSSIQPGLYQRLRSYIRLGGSEVSA